MNTVLNKFNVISDRNLKTIVGGRNYFAYGCGKAIGGALKLASYVLPFFVK